MTTDEPTPTDEELAAAELAATRAEVARLRRLLVETADAIGAKPDECGSDFALLADLVRGRPEPDTELLRITLTLGREPDQPGHTIAQVTATGRILRNDEGKLRPHADKRMVPDRLVLDRDRRAELARVFGIFTGALRPHLDMSEQRLREGLASGRW